MRIVIKILLALVLLFACLTTVAAYQAWRWLNTPIVIPEHDRTITIEPGESFAYVAMRLDYAGIIRYPDLWRYYGVYVEKKTIKAGEFLLPQKATPIEILETLNSFDVVLHSITFPEGLTYRQWYDLIQAEEKLEHQLADIPIDAHKNHLDFNEDYPEGWFFPDTYKFTRGDTDIDILNRVSQGAVAFSNRILKGIEVNHD